MDTTLERILWAVAVSVAGVGGFRYGARRAPAPAGPVELSAEVRAYVDQKITASIGAAAVPTPAAPEGESVLRRLEERVAALDQVAQTRASVLPKCEDVRNEARRLFDTQASVLALQRDQEVSRLRNQTAAACANAVGAVRRNPKLRSATDGPRATGK